MKCEFKNCNKEAETKGYCEEHYPIYRKGDKKIGVYVMEFISKEGTFFYVGMTFSQDINSEVSKHKSAIINQESNKDKKLQKCFNKICLEHPELDRKEVYTNYVKDYPLDSYDAIGGRILQLDEDGTYIEVNDKETIKRIYLNKYESFIRGKIDGRSGVNKKFDFSQLTDDEREIFKFIEYEYIRICKKETYWINKLAETHGRKFCLNKKKLKAVS
ncbi:hypothetical protein J2Z44_002973 [Clostridium punense]|uniref:GIY-YIG domain-containing protein n=1 Tax=Clostridium punense TaxID=1054297 RepID=A0ABS4K5T3_9CLOT|nr:MULTISPECIES: hypothetical protein [Clostridium]EQB86558.1 hypothetical protein M918_13785 [Clostridium sp. BL8]MBP2023138.1 hypothetical protein [Clostridium punense]